MDKKFFSYAAVGVLNTAIHWIVFFLVFNFVNRDQAFSNFIAFCVAVSFSFFANTKVTFKSTATTTRYVLYVTFMGFLSIAIGFVSVYKEQPPLFTLVFFSAISLVFGYIYSKHIVFKERK